MDIKKNFLAGKMNKDSDLRLVAQGEYRDAQNVEVVTSEGSDVGTIQNTKGNTEVTITWKQDELNTNVLSPDATTVGMVTDSENKKIYKFIKDTTSLVANGQFLGHVRYTGFKSDSIVELTQGIDPTKMDGNIVLNDCYESRHIINTQTDLNKIYGLDSLQTEDGFVPAGVKIGQEVKAIMPDGTNLWSGTKVVVTELLSSSTDNNAKIKVTTVPALITTDLIILGCVITFTSPKVLKFRSGTVEFEANTDASLPTPTPKNTHIHSINVLGDQLMFTDGINEPKKLSIPRSIAGSSNFKSHSILKIKEFESSSASYIGSTYIDESHVTTIKKNPLSPPKISSNEATTFGALVTPILGGTGGANFGATVFSVSSTVTTIVDYVLPEDGGYVEETAVWSAGHQFYIQTTFNTTYPDNSFLRIVGQTTGAVAVLKIIEIYSDNKYKVSLVTPPDDTYDGTEDPESWIASVLDQDLLFPDEFLTFAYRYKYTDNEYSAFSPYSKPAFVPGIYSFSSKSAFNNGMENRVKTITVSDFVPASVPADVVAVDVVYRTSKSDRIFLMKSVKRTDDSYSVPGTGSATGSLEINSKVFGPVMDSKQELRIFDGVPRAAATQEIIGNRLIYGNYKENYNLVVNDTTPVELDITTGVSIIPNSFGTSFESSYAMRATQTEADYLNAGTSPMTGYTGIDYGVVPIPYSFEYDPANVWYQDNNVYNVPVTGLYSFKVSQSIQAFTDVVGGPVISEVKLRKCNQTGTVIGDVLAVASVTTESDYQLFQTSGGFGDMLLDAVDIQLDASEFVCAVLSHRLDPDYPDYNGDTSRILRALEGDFQVTSAPSVTNSMASFQGSSSVKADRTYQIGVVYGDEYGRETPVIIEENSSFTLEKDLNASKTLLNTKINSRAPHWASYYKFFMKENTSRYHNIVLEAAFQNNDGEFAWLIFNSSDINKVNVGDYLSQVKLHGSNGAVSNRAAKWKIVAIEKDASQGSLGETLVDASSEFTGKFFVKVNLDANFINYIGDLAAASEGEFDSLQNDNGAVFEVLEDKTADLDLFYEASKAFPLTLDHTNAEEYIEIGSKVEFHVDSSQSFTNTQLQAIAQNNGLGFTVTGITNSAVEEFIQINISGEGIYFDAAAADIGVDVRFVNEDKSFTSLKLKSGVGGTSFKVSRFTQPSGSSLESNLIQLPWFNCYAFGNGVQSDTIRDDFNSGTIFPYIATGKTSGFKATLPAQDYREQVRSNQLIFSEIYNDNSGVNGLNQFLSAEAITKTLSPEHGPVKRLFARDTDLLVFCEDKVLKVLASKDALYKADGDPELLATNNVLGQAIAVTGDYGISNNPESLASDEYRIYFADAKRGAILRLSMDGLTPISAYGMTSWFRDHLKNSQAVLGSFNSARDEYNITLHEVTNPLYKKNVYTVSFTELTKGWTSFRSFIPEAGVSLNNYYYTDRDGITYRHQSNETRNNFYGVQYETSFTGIVNESAEAVKAFRTLDYEGSQSRVIEFNTEVSPEGFNHTDGEYYNTVAKNGWYVDSIVTDQQTGEIPEFLNIEGKWHNNITGKELLHTNQNEGAQELNNMNSADFNIQGIGELETYSVQIGPIPAMGYTVAFPNLAGGNDFEAFTINEYTNYNTTLIGTTQTFNFTIEPKPGYVLSASDFGSNVNSTYVNAIEFVDLGTPNTYSNVVQGNIIMSGDDATSDLTIDIALITSNSGLSLATVNVNVLADTNNPSSILLVQDVEGDFINLSTLSTGQYLINGFAPANVGLSSLATLSYSALPGYYYTAPPTYILSDLENQGISVFAWDVSTENGSPVSYTADIAFEQNSPSNVDDIAIFFSDGELAPLSMTAWPLVVNTADDQTPFPFTYGSTINTGGFNSPPTFTLIDTGDGLDWINDALIISNSSSVHQFKFTVDTNSLGARSAQAIVSSPNVDDITINILQDPLEYIVASWTSSVSPTATLQVPIAGINSIDDGLGGIFDNSVTAYVNVTSDIDDVILTSKPSWVTEMFRSDGNQSNNGLSFSSINFSVDTNYGNGPRSGAIVLHHPSGSISSTLIVEQEGYDPTTSFVNMLTYYELDSSANLIGTNIPQNEIITLPVGTADDNYFLFLEGSITTSGTADLTTLPEFQVEEVTEDFYPNADFEYAPIGTPVLSFNEANRLFMTLANGAAENDGISRYIRIRMRHPLRNTGWDVNITFVLPSQLGLNFTGSNYSTALAPNKWITYDHTFDNNIPQLQVSSYSSDGGASYSLGEPLWIDGIFSPTSSAANVIYQPNYTDTTRILKIEAYTPNETTFNGITSLATKTLTQLVRNLVYSGYKIGSNVFPSQVNSIGLATINTNALFVNPNSSGVNELQYNTQSSAPIVEYHDNGFGTTWISEAYGGATEGGPATTTTKHLYGLSPNSSGSPRSVKVKIFATNGSSFVVPGTLPDATIILTQS